MASNETDFKTRFEVKRWTQTFILYIRANNNKNKELGQVIGVTERTISEWNNPKYADIKDGDKFKIPSKSNFLKLAMIRLQFDYLKEQKSFDKGSLLAMSSMPVLGGLVGAGAAALGVGATGATIASLSGAAAVNATVAALGGLALFNPIVLGIIGSAIALKVVDARKKDNREDLMSLSEYLVDHMAAKFIGGNASWDEIIEFINEFDSSFDFSKDTYK